MVWRILAFRQNCLETCRATHILSVEKCSPGNTFSGSIMFIQISAGVRWRGGVKWECGHWKWRFRFFRSLASEHFTSMATQQLSREMTVD